MQKAKKTEIQTGQEGNDITPARIQHKATDKEQRTSDAGVMAHSAEVMKEDPSIPHFALPLKAGQVIVPGMQLTRPASSSLLAGLGHSGPAEVVPRIPDPPYSENTGPPTGPRQTLNVASLGGTGPLGTGLPMGNRPPSYGYPIKEPPPESGFCGSHSRYPRPIREQSEVPGGRMLGNPRYPQFKTHSPITYAQFTPTGSQMNQKPMNMTGEAYKHGSQSNAAGTALLDLLHSKKVRYNTGQEHHTVLPANLCITEQNILKSVQESANYSTQPEALGDIFALLGGHQDPSLNPNPLRNQSPSYYPAGYKTEESAKTAQFVMPVSIKNLYFVLCFIIINDLLTCFHIIKLNILQLLVYR